jgi:hypothetical protein
MSRKEQLEYINDIKYQWKNEDILAFIKDMYNRGTSDQADGVVDFDNAFESESM